MSKTYQFVRLKGFQRGARSKRNTLGAVVAEGLREPTHISHLLRPPAIDWKRIDSPVENPAQIEDWLSLQMDEAINIRRHNRVLYQRKLRSDALALGAVISSWPEPVEATENTPAYNQDKFRAFAEETTEWIKDFLEPFEMLVHFRLEHYDEKYPHIHLWFSPYPNDIRTVNWSLAHVCNGPKQFMHNLQTRFFNEVGHKYFDEWARPYSERKPRVNRREAIARRELQEKEIVHDLKKQEPTYKLFSAALDTLDKLNSGEEPFDEQRLTPSARKVLHRFQLMPDKVVLEDQRQRVPQKAALEKVEKSESGDVYSPGVLVRWNQVLLMPALLNAIRENEGQSQHLDYVDWLSIVIDDVQAKIENELSLLGLSDHPIGQELLALLGDPASAENLLNQLDASVTQKLVALSSGERLGDENLRDPVRQPESIHRLNELS